MIRRSDQNDRISLLVLLYYFNVSFDVIHDGTSFVQ